MRSLHPPDPSLCRAPGPRRWSGSGYHAQKVPVNDQRWSWTAKAARLGSGFCRPWNRWTAAGRVTGWRYVPRCDGGFGRPSDDDYACPPVPNWRSPASPSPGRM